MSIYYIFYYNYLYARNINLILLKNNKENIYILAEMTKTFFGMLYAPKKIRDNLS